VNVDQRLAELGIELPEPARPVASYVPVVVAGRLAYVSGQVPLDGGRPLWTGKLGRELALDDGVMAARRCALQVLSALRERFGTLDPVEHVVKLTVFVASAEGFIDQPKVANGASDLLAEVFGEAGRHARSAVGVAELPLGVPVEVEAIARIRPEA
jgi:enamine deaminase RidA (YjgF/YER057c/UK114 family)